MMTPDNSASLTSVEPVRLGSPGRVKSGWNRPFSLGEDCVIPLASDDPNLETRVFLKHDGVFYLQPLGDWKHRGQIRFLPEAPGAYQVEVQWRRPDGTTGWTEAAFEVSHQSEMDPSPRLVTVDPDIKLWVPSAWESQMAPAHEKMALHLAGQCVRKGATIYDIGANLGLYSVLLSRIAGSGGHLYCLEANPVCLYFLQANLVLNRVASFDILPVAVLGTATGAEFRINYRNLLVGIAGPVPYMGKPGHIIDVRATPLDDLIELHDLRPPDFIKMDIEGAEVEAIKGMRRTVERYHPTMLVELHGQDAAKGTLNAADWSGYSFQEASSGRSFETAASLSAWFPDACLQVIAKHS